MAFLTLLWAQWRLAGVASGQGRPRLCILGGHCLIAHGTLHVRGLDSLGTGRSSERRFAQRDDASTGRISDNLELKSPSVAQ